MNTTEINDSDYQPVPSMQIVKHKLWPVSYVKDGKQYNALWTFNPTLALRDGEQYFVGEFFTVETLHPAQMDVDERLQRIAELKAELESLEQDSDAA